MSNAMDDRCCDCSRPVPVPTSNDDEGIADWGWHLMETVESGKAVLRWRCRACWSDYRRRRSRMTVA